MTRTASRDVEAEAESLLPGLFLTIVDDYYGDPEAVRQFAVESEFARPFTGAWQGLHSLRRHPDTEVVFQDIARRLPVSGTPNWDEVEESYRFWNRPSAGVFALLLDGQSDAVHSHKRTGRWAGLCYLNTPSQFSSDDGLRLYRHIATGATSCADASAADLAKFRSEGTDDSLWELVMTVPMAFNRMIIFDGQFFHAASDGFGSDAKTGRLAQLFAIEIMP